jgi:hypothetical protein
MRAFVLACVLVPSASPFGFNGRYLYLRTQIEVP